MRAPLLLLLASCNPNAAPASSIETSSADVSPPAGLPPYEDVVAAIEAARITLSERYRAAPETERPAVVALARDTVLAAIEDDLFPRWVGTPWAFYGTTTTPGTGTIACGYFVSTVLEDAGFRVERVRLAQQASEHIILSLVPRDAVHRYSYATAGRVVDAVRAEGEGLYLLGLDYHVAFLAVRDGDVRMCHASYVGESAVTCEDALASPAMASDYRVTGKLLADPMMEAWLDGDALPTVTR